MSRDLLCHVIKEHLVFSVVKEDVKKERERGGNQDSIRQNLSNLLSDREQVRDT